MRLNHRRHRSKRERWAPNLPISGGAVDKGVHTNENSAQRIQYVNTKHVNRWVLLETGDTEIQGFYFYRYTDRNWYLGIENGEGWAMRITGDPDGWVRLF